MSTESFYTESGNSPPKVRKLSRREIHQNSERRVYYFFAKGPKPASLRVINVTAKEVN